MAYSTLIPLSMLDQTFLDGYLGQQLWQHKGILKL